MAERDTHFKNFARLLWADAYNKLEFSIDTNDDRFTENLKQLLAQRAYDLVYFLLDKAPYHSGSFDTGWGSPGEIHETIAHLPDLTEWPPTTPESPTAE